MEHVQPILVGISGPSCSGKSGLAQSLVTKLSSGAYSVVSTDSYYRGENTISQSTNFDLPEAIDCDLLIRHLEQLKRGIGIVQPQYDFVTHKRHATGRRTSPTKVTILEGLFSFYWPTLRTLVDVKVFLEADFEICLSRRIVRDTAERGDTREAIIRYFTSVSWPTYVEHVFPTRAFADVVIDARADSREQTLRLVHYLKSKGIT